MTLQEIQDLITQIDAATQPASVTNIMVARVLQWLLTHLSEIEEIDVHTLDEEALRIQDTSENEYPMPGNTMQVLDIDAFNSLQRLQDNVLYVVTQAVPTQADPQIGEATL